MLISTQVHIYFQVTNRYDLYDFVKQYMTILLKNITATGLWIAFGITGVIVLVFLVALALFVRRIRSAPSVQHGTLQKKPLFIFMVLNHLFLFLT